MTAPDLSPPQGSVLITGASGFIGTQVLALGRALGAEIHTFGRTAPKGVSIHQEVHATTAVRELITTSGSGGAAGAEAHEPDERWHDEDVVHHPGDLEEVSTLRTVIQKLKPSVIIHLAAAGVAYGQTNTAALLRVNSLPLVGLFEAASALPRRAHVICAGSGFEYAPLRRARVETDPTLPNSPYGVSKAAATAIAANYAMRLPVTVLRPFSLYGVGEPAGRLAPYLIAQALAGTPVDLTAGEQMRDYAEVCDVAEAFWRAAAEPPSLGRIRVLNIASGHRLTLRAFCEEVSAALARAGCTAELHFGARPYRRDEMMDYTADISLLEHTLGWIPHTTLEQGLDRMVAAQMAAAAVSA